MVAYASTCCPGLSWPDVTCVFGWLQNFKSIKSRGAIQQQMLNKLVDILEQFEREIVAAQEIFDRSRNNPPRTRNQPPVAGGCSMLHGWSEVQQTGPFTAMCCCLLNRTLAFSVVWQHLCPQC